MKCSGGSVNAAVEGGSIRILVFLAAAYFGFGIVEGLLKLGMNVYRGWVSEIAVRWLRTSIASLSRLEFYGPARHEGHGTEIAMTLSEAEPIGAFVGSSVSEPFLQGGILISVFAYMVYLQPMMALVAFGVFFPQSVIVPIMQRALNRRVSVRIWTLRKISTGLVEDESRGSLSLELQNRQVGRVFDLNMGIYKIKFSLNFVMIFSNMQGWLAFSDWVVSWSPREKPISAPSSPLLQVSPRSTIPGVISSPGIETCMSPMSETALFRARCRHHHP